MTATWEQKQLMLDVMEFLKAWKLENGGQSDQQVAVSDQPEVVPVELAESVEMQSWTYSARPK